jgi:hypothetical protein
MGRRKPKRLKTGDEPDEEVIIVKVRVKVESDGNEEEESSDDDDNEEDEQEQEEQQQDTQPVAQVEQPAYVEPRPDYILMDYNRSMGDIVIPDYKVIRPMNRWCYTNLDPVH